MLVKTAIAGFHDCHEAKYGIFSASLIAASAVLTIPLFAHLPYHPASSSPS